MAYTTIDKPTDYFNTITYTGNDTDGRTITGVGFQSDWTWVKARSSAFSPYIIDAIRYDSGASKYLKLDSSSNAADETPSGAGWISALNSDGYVCKNGTSNTNNCNENGVTYVAWNWLAGGSGSSNSDGSITSTVSANTTAGFSIVSYTGNGTGGATFGHGLGSAPKIVIIKSRSLGTESWQFWFNNTSRLNLNSTTASLTTHPISTSSTLVTTPSSSNDSWNTSGQTYISYCFAEKTGYSKFDSYTGNGNADGTFVYTGFKPAWVMVKESSGTSDWSMYDNKREPFNVADSTLEANTGDAEAVVSGRPIDILSNGFKLRGDSSYTNESGATYIYMAFSEAPFVNSNGVPTNAR